MKPRVYRRRRFPSVYTRADIELLAQADEAHETLSGPATQKIPQRELHEFHDSRYERLARLSVAQLVAQEPDVPPASRRLSTHATHAGVYRRAA